MGWGEVLHLFRWLTHTHTRTHTHTAAAELFKAPTNEMKVKMKAKWK